MTKIDDMDEQDLPTYRKFSNEDLSVGWHDPKECLIYDVSDYAEDVLNNVRKNYPSEDFISLIICSPTRIYWTNQSNCNGCSHPKAEGYLLDYDNDGHAVHNECGWDLLESCTELEIDEIICKINDSFKEYKGYERTGGIISHLEFDNERRNDFMEAWIPVKVALKQYSNVYKQIGITIKKGYLCLGNCD